MGRRHPLLELGVLIYGDVIWEASSPGDAIWESLFRETSFGRLQLGNVIWVSLYREDVIWAHPRSSDCSKEAVTFRFAAV